ncbi:response regulator receiver modulated diguanylate cyclase [Geothermobacter ehrlichii]|uniref:diguanylate cyclase n=1 Tax=Geothermobacter ehrlichii TaxID=213224 RepID=A0A5D3WI14_9BACT|nr:diguanylate cyclase [Geothermobacter ehrlichii]TYO96365.1 response regulator receiver modulated diguanylate cyclase [Geothermobacter ehrlichii]
MTGQKPKLQLTHGALATPAHRADMPSSILIIDDSPQARQQVIEILQPKSLFNFFYEAGDGIEGFKTALNRKVDIVLCDLEMPGMDGFKFLQMMNSREELADIPVIMVTGREDTETKVRGLEQGASDYVTKPYDPAELIARVKVQIKIKSLQDKLKRSNQMLLELSLTDPLTGLNNRRYMMEVLDREFERSQRSGASLCLVMIDIDHFKRVNDTYGHQKGDVVLRGLADLLRKHLRQYDTAARFGGEEFALILPETDLGEAALVAERLRRATEKLTFTQIPGLQVSASLGVACYPMQGIDVPDDLIREADYALYNAKRLGRNRVEVMEN